MRLAAWNSGVLSCLFNGIGASYFARDFRILGNLSVTLVLGSGYPKRKRSLVRERTANHYLSYLSLKLLETI
jgi:hypothetical protein